MRAKKEIDAKHGERVETTILTRTDLEGFYHPDAIVGWLLLQSHRQVDIDGAVRQVLDEAPSRVKALGKLAKDYLSVPYDKLNHGRAIASLTTEPQIDPEIKSLLLRIAS